MASQRDQLMQSFGRRAGGRGRQLNTNRSSPRFGQRYRVVTKGGQRFHDYGGGKLIADKGPAPRTTKPVSTPTTPGFTTAPSKPSLTPEQQALLDRVTAGARQNPTMGLGVKPTPKTPTNIGPPSAPTPTQAASAERAKTIRQAYQQASGQGARLNVVGGSARFGQRFDIVKRKGTRYHRYAPGRLIADVKRGRGSVASKPKPII